MAWNGKYKNEGIVTSVPGDPCHVLGIVEGLRANGSAAR